MPYTSRLKNTKKITTHYQTFFSPLQGVFIHNNLYNLTYATGYKHDVNKPDITLSYKDLQCL